MHFEEEDNSEIERLIEQVDSLEEEVLFLKSDLEKAKHENRNLKMFLSDLVLSCDTLDAEEELELKAVLKNLKQSIRQFAKDNYLEL